MDLISEEYLRLNQELHKNSPAFGKGGDKHANIVQALCRYYKTENVLDYGCGKGRLQRALPFQIKEYDPGILEKSIVVPADLVICTDVLEHIEPEYLTNVLKHIASLMRIAGYFVISTILSTKELSDGRNTHLIVKQASWWRNKLDGFRIVTEIETDDTVEFYLEAK